MWTSRLLTVVQNFSLECLRTQTRVKQNFFSVSFREEKRGEKEEEFLKKKKKKKSLLLPFEKRPHFYKKLLKERKEKRPRRHIDCTKTTRRFPKDDDATRRERDVKMSSRFVLASSSSSSVKVTSSSSSSTSSSSSSDRRRRRVVFDARWSRRSPPAPASSSASSNVSIIPLNFVREDDDDDDDSFGRAATETCRATTTTTTTAKRWWFEGGRRAFTAAIGRGESNANKNRALAMRTRAFGSGSSGPSSGKSTHSTTNKLNAMIAPASPIGEDEDDDEEEKEKREEETTAREEEPRSEKGMAFLAKIAKVSIIPSSNSDSKNSSLTKLEKEEETTKTTSTCNQIGRDNVRIATNENDFEVVANLRATAFYDDLTERQALPFPPRFTPTFHREFAQRERKALAERVVRSTLSCAKCVCLVADDSAEDLVVEGLRNSSSAVIGCLDVSIRHNPLSSSSRYKSPVAVTSSNDSYSSYSSGPETGTFVYVDNVAVARGARRRGAAKALLEAASNEAISWGAREMFTHVHCENVAARRLYHAYGFRVVVPAVEESATSTGGDGEERLSANSNNGNRFGRLAGLVMIRAPLPLKRDNKELSSSDSCDCGFEVIEEIDKCVCGKASCKDPSKRLIPL